MEATERGELWDDDTADELAAVVDELIEIFKDAMFNVVGRRHLLEMKIRV